MTTHASVEQLSAPFLNVEADQEQSCNAWWRLERRALRQVESQRGPAAYFRSHRLYLVAQQ